jgi:hypothetical protein
VVVGVDVSRKGAKVRIVDDAIALYIAPWSKLSGVI